MIILMLLLLAVFAVAIFLSGEGDRYGAGNSSEGRDRKFSASDKNYFL